MDLHLEFKGYSFENGKGTDKEKTDLAKKLLLLLMLMVMVDKSLLELMNMEKESFR